MAWTRKRQRSYRETVIRRLRTWCRNHGWWPSSRELAGYRETGHPGRVWRVLDELAGVGLVERVGSRGWRPTAAGFELLRAEPIVARLPGKPSKARRQRARKRGRVAAAAVLDRLGLDVVE